MKQIQLAFIVAVLLFATVAYAQAQHQYILVSAKHFETDRPHIVTVLELVNLSDSENLVEYDFVNEPGEPVLQSQAVLPPHGKRSISTSPLADEIGLIIFNGYIRVTSSSPLVGLGTSLRVEEDVYYQTVQRISHLIEVSPDNPGDSF